MSNLLSSRLKQTQNHGLPALKMPEPAKKPVITSGRVVGTIALTIGAAATAALINYWPDIVKHLHSAPKAGTVEITPKNSEISTDTNVRCARALAIQAEVKTTDPLADTEGCPDDMIERVQTSMSPINTAIRVRDESGKITEFWRIEDQTDGRRFRVITKGDPDFETLGSY